jgi:hypothetical protein
MHVFQNLVKTFTQFFTTHTLHSQLTTTFLTLNTLVVTTMMPTTTNSRNKRPIDEPMCLPFLRKPCREEETSKHGQISQSWFFRFIRSKAVSSNNRLRLVDSMGMPDSVYSLIWSFILDSGSEKGSSLDFKSIMSFMLVSKTSKGAFDDCRGWWLCAKALKREAELKRWWMIRFMMRVFQYMDLWKANLVKLSSNRKGIRDKIKQAREVDARLLLIQSTLLPEASRLAILYGGDSVSMHHYHSWDAHLSRFDYYASHARRGR